MSVIAIVLSEADLCDDAEPICVPSAVVLRDLGLSSRTYATAGLPTTRCNSLTTAQNCPQLSKQCLNFASDFLVAFRTNFG